MSRRSRRKPLPELSTTQLIDRDARRLCYAMASASPAPTWLSVEDLASRVRAHDLRIATEVAVNRGWLRAEPGAAARAMVTGGNGRLMLTKLGITIAADQRVAPKRRRA